MKTQITKISQLQDDQYYRVATLKEILKHMGLNYSIFSIMNAETWKCTNYDCGKRYRDKVDKCELCGAAVTEPVIPSPRTLGGGKGAGHRRYSGAEMKQVIAIFQRER